MEPHDPSPPTAATPPVSPTTHFAWIRTRMAIERTLNSWVRTGTGLIGFGFTLFQFLERLDGMKGVAPPQYPGTSRAMALAMIAIGTVALAVAMAEYRAAIAYLWTPEFRPFAGVRERPSWTPALLTASLVVLVGVTTLVVLSLRLADTT